MRTPLNLLIPFLAVLATGCASTARLVPEYSPDSAPPAAALFHSEVTHGREAGRSWEWRFWRSPERVERENLDDATGDLWQRDGRALFHSLLFHGERRGIEFDPADLEMSGGAAPWTQQALIVGPEIISRLRVVRSGWHRGTPFRDYSGSAAGAEWRVRIRTDLMLPVRVVRRSGEDRVRVELQEAYAGDLAPWQPKPSRDYAMLDFADLGDHERDPFVLRVQHGLGLAHEHAH